METKMNQRIETVDEYIRRGGTVTTHTPSPNGISDGAGLYERQEPQGPQIVQTVSWRELYEDADPELDDPKYWKKLNDQLDKIIEKKGIKKLDF